jgi:hypothetical protein
MIALALSPTPRLSQPRLVSKATKRLIIALAFCMPVRPCDLERSFAGGLHTKVTGPQPSLPLWTQHWWSWFTRSLRQFTRLPNRDLDHDWVRVGHNPPETEMQARVRARI